MKFRPGVQPVRVCLGLVATITSAVGCAPAPDPASYTVDDYRHEEKLRELTFTRCAQKPGARDSSLDCINAREAERREGVGSLRELPPLELPSPARTDPSTQYSKPKDAR